MKTAMQELVEQLEFIKLNKTKNLHEVMFFDGVLAIIDAGKYLEKEKEQIIDANRQSRCNDCPFMYSNEDAEQYYNQTYNQTNVGNDGFEFDNSSTIPPPKKNNL
jgi:hypothetical protein